MDEFIREVDEEYRRDRIAKAWSRFGGLIVAALVLMIAGIGGWRYWQHTERQRAEVAATRFEDAVQLARDGKGGEAETALEALAGEAPAGYRTLARFRLAAELGTTDGPSGAKAFDALAADPSVDPGLQGLARLRSASLKLGADETAAAARRDLEAMAAPSNPWRHSARELLALSALKRGEFEAAGRWFDQVAADRETPPNLRGRLEIYTAIVAGGPVQTTQ